MLLFVGGVVCDGGVVVGGVVIGGVVGGGIYINTYYVQSERHEFPSVTGLGRSLKR